MQNQTKPKPLGAPMAKLFLAIAIIVSLGAMLGVTGYLAKNKAVKIQQPQVSPAAEPAKSVEDETADWKTYRNEEHGFEFKYPLNYKINERKGSIEISTETQKGEWLIKIDFAEGYNLFSGMGASTFDELATDIIHQYYCIYMIEKYDITCTNNIEKKEFINKHGIKGLEFNIEEAIEDTYLGNKTTRTKEPIFVLDLDKQEDNIVKPITLDFNDRNGALEEKERNNIIDQILSTFKFIEK